ncbi:MAG: methyltransferase domain-containing protein [Solirubrobacteraceae bacterium]
MASARSTAGLLWSRSADLLFRASVPVARITLAGDRYECICGATWRHFMRFNGRPNACCPRCGALERHRLMWLFLQNETHVLSGEPLRVLHFAPEPLLVQRLRSLPAIDYLTADLFDPIADYKLDICDLSAFADESFDLILCCHVLEHVASDTKALKELRRVLRSGGELVMQHPIDQRLAHTDEDPSIVDPAERLARFGQSNHVRTYGADFGERVRSAGFELERRRYANEVDPRVAVRFQLHANVSDGVNREDIYACHRA